MTSSLNQGREGERRERRKTGREEDEVRQGGKDGKEEGRWGEEGLEKEEQEERMEGKKSRHPMEGTPDRYSMLSTPGASPVLLKLPAITVEQSLLPLRTRGSDVLLLLHGHGNFPLEAVELLTPNSWSFQLLHMPCGSQRCLRLVVSSSSSCVHWHRLPQ